MLPQANVAALCCARSLDRDVTVLVALFSFVTQNVGTAPSYFFEIRLDLLSVKVCGLFLALEQTA